MIMLTGYVYLAPSAVGEFVADVRAIALHTRAQPGCLFYAAAVDDAAAGRVLVVERWQDQAALSAHLERQATSAFATKWMSRIRIDVRAFDASNERPPLAQPAT